MSFDITQLEPLPPNEGPPLPKIFDSWLPFGGYWPWYKSVVLTGVVKTDTGTFVVAKISVGTTYTYCNSLTGVYTLTKLSKGVVTVKVSADGYDTQTLTPTLVDGTNKLNITLTATGGGGGGGGGGECSISGYVISDLTTQIIPGAHLSAGGVSIDSDENAHFSITGLPAGDTTLVAQANGYEDYSADVVLVAGDTPVTVRMTLKASAEAKVSGTITSSTASKMPLQGVVVNLKDPDTGTSVISAYTNNDGVFNITGQIAGPYNYEATKDGYVARTGSITLVAGNNPLDLTMTPVQTTEPAILDLGADYIGRIEGDPGYWNLAVPNATFHVVGNGFDITKSLAGIIPLTYRVVFPDQFTPGDYAITATASGFSTVTKKITLASGRNNITIRMVQT